MSELLKINVNEHTEKKNGLTYLSWAWAWAEVLKVDPGAKWSAMNFQADGAPTAILCQMPDGTAMVGTYVTIMGITRECMLPVMDHRNKAIPNPNAFDVNKAIMRCLAKAISMHGLGLYIYAGEDLPEGEEPEPEPEKPKQRPRPAHPDDPIVGFGPHHSKLIRATAQSAIQAFNEGNEWKAYEEVVSCLDTVGAATDRNSVLLALSSIFQPYSALRASLKKHMEAEREKQKALEHGATAA